MIWDKISERGLLQSLSDSFISEESSLDDLEIDWKIFIPFFEKTNLMSCKTIKLIKETKIYTLVPMMKTISEEICKDNDF